MKLLTNIILFTQLTTEAFVNIQNPSLKCDAQCHELLKAAVSQAIQKFRYGINTEASRVRRSQATEYERLCILEYVHHFRTRPVIV